MCFHIYQKINIKVIVEIVSEEPTKILFKITIPMKFCRSCNIGLIKVFVSKLHDLKTEKQKIHFMVRQYFKVAISVSIQQFILISFTPIGYFRFGGH